MTWNYRKKYMIGIDTGTKTGVAIWDVKAKAFSQISTLKIQRAMELVKQYKEHDIHVFVEDARKAVFGRSNDMNKAQGAGSVKRDAAIWEDFLKDLGVPFTMKRPNKRATKLSKKQFYNLTKYTGLTSEHSRDAACMVFGM